VTTVVAGVIERDGRVLIAQRKRGTWHALKWEFPGGKVEPGEATDAALARELQEELAITAHIGPEIMRYEYEYPSRSRILLIFYRVTDFDGQPQNLEFENMEWVEQKRLPGYDFLDGDAEFLRHYCA
jgi:8-oxo-dGTP diphosphatase